MYVQTCTKDFKKKHFFNRQAVSKMAACDSGQNPATGFRLDD